MSFLTKIKFPDPLVLLMLFIIGASIATYIVPSGKFDRTMDHLSNREVVVSGSFHEVESKPVSLFQMFVSIPKGMQQAASVIFFVFLVGGAFVVIDRTGALTGLVEWVAHKLDGRESLMIPITITLFATLGTIQNFQEEIIPLVPVLLLLCNRMGFNNLTAVAISIGAAIVGASFSPINPFQVGIAQKIAGVELLSGIGFRSIFLFVAVIIYIILIYRYANKNKIERVLNDTKRGVDYTRSHRAIITLLGLSFIMLVLGVSKWDWDFEQMAALFFILGILGGIIGGLGVSGTVKSFIEGFKDMAYAGLIIGFARAIFVVLEDGLIVDSMVNGMFTPMSQLSPEISLFGITAMQSLLHFPVPSVSGQAVLTMPLLAPLADLMGISRQLMVLSYQYGAGLAELIVPTNGAVMAILVASRVSFSQWVRFSIKAFVILLAVGLLAIFMAKNMTI